jgi:protease I
MKALEGFRVAILATDGVEQAELDEPRKALDAAGAHTSLVSPGPGTIQGMNHADKSDRIPVERLLRDVSPDDFDALLLPGGVVNADKLRVDPDAQKLVTAMDKRDKPIAVICHAPWLLISAGLVKGRHLTSYHTLQEDIRNAGGLWTDEEVVRHKNWVSSREPSDIPSFNRAVNELFAESISSRTHTPSVATHSEYKKGSGNG